MSVYHSDCLVKAVCEIIYAKARIASEAWGEEENLPIILSDLDDACYNIAYMAGLIH